MILLVNAGSGHCRYYHGHHLRSVRFVPSTVLAERPFLRSECERVGLEASGQTGERVCLSWETGMFKGFGELSSFIRVFWRRPVVSSCPVFLFLATGSLWLGAIHPSLRRVPEPDQLAHRQR